MINITPSFRWGKRNSKLPIVNEKKKTVKATKTDNLTFETDAIVRSLTEEPTASGYAQVVFVDNPEIDINELEMQAMMKQDGETLEDDEDDE